MAKKELTDEQAYQALVETYGKAEISRAAGFKSRQAVTRWTKVPHQHVASIAASLGIPKTEVLPSY